MPSGLARLIGSRATESQHYRLTPANSEPAPVGSTLGQQRYREGLVVREEQPRFAGCLVSSCRVEIEASMRLSDRSMAALWLCGFEDDPDQLRCGELCVFEVFGNALGPGPDPSAEVGVGIKAFRDPTLVGCESPAEFRRPTGRRRGRRPSTAACPAE